MIYHENRLLADDSHEISFLIFFRKLAKMLHNLSSAAVVIGSLRVMLTDYLNLIMAVDWDLKPQTKQNQGQWSVSMLHCFGALI